MYFRNDVVDIDLYLWKKKPLGQVDNGMPLSPRANDHRMEIGYGGRDGLCVGAYDADERGEDGDR